MDIFEKIREFLRVFAPDAPKPKNGLISLAEEIEREHREEEVEEEVLTIVQDIEESYVEPITVSKEEFVRAKLAVKEENYVLTDEEAEDFFKITPQEAALEAQYLREQFPDKPAVLPEKAAVKNANLRHAADVSTQTRVLVHGPDANTVRDGNDFYYIQPHRNS